MISKALGLALCMGLFSQLALADAGMDSTGWVGIEGTLFWQDGQAPQQRGNDLSVAVQPEFFVQSEDEKNSFLFVPFVRYDANDSARTHADIRQLKWTFVGEDEWELHAGIGKVFWGVTESVHLVDIINQTDLVENPDGEEKLGQPMLNLALVKSWGTLDLFVLPGFRQRTFPGEAGRFRSIPEVDTERPQFEASNGERHVDWAVRYSLSWEVLDIGLSHFSGTSREPRLEPALDSQGRVVLRPVYDLIDQTGLDLQATVGSWLWKLEAISRTGQGERFFASVSGFEYTFNGVYDSDTDLGGLLEYLYDERGRNASTPFEDDLFLGMRLAFNDTQDTDLLAGVIVDLSGQGRAYTVEANRRINDQWKASLQAQVFSHTDSDPLLAALREDDHVRLDLKYYF